MKTEKLKPPCKHELLYFDKGGFFVLCSDCDAGWRSSLPPNYVVVNPAARGWGLGNKDIRKKP